VSSVEHIKILQQTIDEQATEFRVKESALTKQLNKFHNLQLDLAAAKTAPRQRTIDHQQQADDLTTARQETIEATNDLDTAQLQLATAQTDLPVALLDAVGDEMAESSTAPGPFYGHHLQNAEYYVKKLYLMARNQKTTCSSGCTGTWGTQRYS